MTSIEENVINELTKKDSGEELQTYRDALLQVWMAYRVLDGLGIRKLLSDISKAETLGPLVDPTMWIKNHRAMEVDKRALSAAQTFLSAMRKIEAEALSMEKDL